MHSLRRTAHRNTTVLIQIPMCSPSDVTQQQTQIPAYRRSVVIATELRSNEQTPHFGEKPQRMAVADRLLSYTTPPNTDSGVQSFTCPATGSASAQPGHVKTAAHRNTTLPILTGHKHRDSVRTFAEPGHVETAANSNSTPPNTDCVVDERAGVIPQLVA